VTAAIWMSSTASGWHRKTCHLGSSNGNGHGKDTHWGMTIHLFPCKVIYLSYGVNIITGMGRCVEENFNCWKGKRYTSIRIPKPPRYTRMQRANRWWIHIPRYQNVVVVDSQLILLIHCVIQMIQLCLSRRKYQQNFPERKQ
jgi:hypothetical protein